MKFPLFNILDSQKWVQYVLELMPLELGHPHMLNGMRAQQEARTPLSGNVVSAPLPHDDPYQFCPFCLESVFPIWNVGMVAVLPPEMTLAKVQWQSPRGNS